MSRPIIEVKNISKRYRLGQFNARTMREEVEHFFQRIRKNGQAASPSQTSPNGSEFWALKDVSFSVQPGEVVGIIGRNGAGKSTLLKILSRITEPTSGEIRLRGRVASLLEVGTGFHPELTGRENIYLNGTILGMTKAEVKAKFDEIVAFAEIDRFLDTPVKRYSSGMYVRLAFAVAAHLEPEILIVDEVLAVGDAAFQKKCLGKMGAAANEGRTVLFVSHNMSAVEVLTKQCLLLEWGRVTAKGPTAEIVERYISSSRGDQRQTDFRHISRMSPHLGARARICRIEPMPSTPLGFRLGEYLTFRIHVESKITAGNLRLGGTITDINDTAILSAVTRSILELSEGKQVFDLVIRDSRLTPGAYTLALSIGGGDLTEARHNLDVVRPGPLFAIVSLNENGDALFNWSRTYGHILHPKHLVEVFSVRGEITRIL